MSENRSLVRKSSSQSSSSSSAANPLSKSRDWILRNVLFLDPDLPPFKNARAREDEMEAARDRDAAANADGLSSSLRLFECNLIIGGRRNLFKVRVYPPSPGGGDPGAVGIFHHITNEEVRSLDARTLFRVVKREKVALALLFKESKLGQQASQFEIVCEFRSAKDCDAFGLQLTSMLGKTIEESGGGGGSSAALERKKNQPKKSDAANTEAAGRVLLIRGYGLAEEPLQVVLAKLGTEINDAGDASDLKDGEEGVEALDGLSLRPSALATARWRQAGGSDPLYPFRKVEWFVSSGLGGGNLNFEIGENRSALRSTTKMIPTTLLSGRFVQVRVELDPKVREAVDLTGRMIVTKGPILPSVSICQALLAHFARGRTEMQVLMKITELRDVLARLQRVDSRLNFYVKSLEASIHKAKHAEGDEGHRREATLSMSNRRFRITLEFPDLPPLKNLEFLWTEAVFVLPNPCDLSTGDLITQPTKEAAHHIYFSFLTHDGSQLIMLTLECMSMLSRDLLWHTAYFFYINRGPELRDFHEWQTDQKAGNLANIQRRFRDAWLTFDGATVTAELAIPAIWNPRFQAQRDEEMRQLRSFAQPMDRDETKAQLRADRSGTMTKQQDQRKMQPVEAQAVYMTRVKKFAGRRAPFKHLDTGSGSELSE